MTIRKLIFGFLIFTVQAWGATFPTGPDLRVTPGSLCNAGRPRHPQGITYCDRNVSTDTKWEIIDEYNNLGLGYDINSSNRSNYKIDHFYPLCIGGSNEKNNLWPQHRTISAQTDDIEQLTCDLVGQGKLKQQDALNYVIRAKTHLDEAAGITQTLRRLSGRQTRPR